MTDGRQRRLLIAVSLVTSEIGTNCGYLNIAPGGATGAAVTNVRELRPAVEAMFARDRELRLGQRDGRRGIAGLAPLDEVKAGGAAAMAAFIIRSKNRA
jgi:hypothetical protein